MVLFGCIFDRYMKSEAIIFDIDGLLIDSEPLWNEAAMEVFVHYGIELTNEQYLSTTGLRTKEFVEWWFEAFKVSSVLVEKAEKEIIEVVLKKITAKPVIMEGAAELIRLAQDKNIKMGMATSSPMTLVKLVSKLFGIEHYLSGRASAQDLTYGKPHPKVYLNCAKEMGVHPTKCLCFEDSFNGMIAAKAARMKVVVVPDKEHFQLEKWGAGDLKLKSLIEMDEARLMSFFE